MRIARLAKDPALAMHVTMLSACNTSKYSLLNLATKLPHIHVLKLSSDLYKRILLLLCLFLAYILRHVFAATPCAYGRSCRQVCNRKCQRQRQRTTWSLDCPEMSESSADLSRFLLLLCLFSCMPSCDMSSQPHQAHMVVVVARCAKESAKGKGKEQPLDCLS